MTSKEIVPKKLFPEFFQAFKWAEKSQNNFSYLKQKSILDHIKINLATLIFGPKNGEYYIDSSSNTVDHQNMANNYLAFLSQALMEHFNISSIEANHLAWGGLHDTSKWENLSQSLKNQIIETNNKYRNSEKGVKCQ